MQVTVFRNSSKTEVPMIIGQYEGILTSNSIPSAFIGYDEVKPNPKILNGVVSAINYGQMREAEREEMAEKGYDYTKLTIMKKKEVVNQLTGLNTKYMTEYELDGRYRDFMEMQANGKMY